MSEDGIIDVAAASESTFADIAQFVSADAVETGPIMVEYVESIWDLAGLIEIKEDSK